MESLIEQELKYFGSDDQRRAFRAVYGSLSNCVESWQYGQEMHICTIVAADEKTQIVFCPTGFGPSFPWGVQRIGQTDLGMDDSWHAYLYEAFVCSTIWPHDPPTGFMQMGPSERRP
ncbi:hypothetical protein [Rhodanobacter ginsengiterrae]|uniref:hypothetical protein n=1 Tax=Rhodanobacter ginsengiterrae TaxID=2008451 RepID=UPI003CEB0246